jgi:hypothetical protein
LVLDASVALHLVGRVSAEPHEVRHGKFWPFPPNLAPDAQRCLTARSGDDVPEMVSRGHPAANSKPEVSGRCE